MGYPPSEKQSALIIKLADQNGIGLDGALELAGVSEISSLTGGGNGTASELIGKLIEMSKGLPATESQVDLIEKLAKQNGYSKQGLEQCRLLQRVAAWYLEATPMGDSELLIINPGRSYGKLI